MEEKKKRREMFVIIPDCKDTFEGIRVAKETEIDFENDYVKQSIKNLVLTTERVIEKGRVTVWSKTEIKLNEGEIVLIEEENRGYFLPSNVKIGTTAEAIEEYKFIQERIDIMNGDK